MTAEHGNTPRRKRGSTTGPEKPRWPLWFICAIVLAVILLAIGLAAAGTGSFALAATLTASAGQTATISALLLEQEKRDRK